MNLTNYVFDLHSKMIGLRGLITTEINKVRNRLLDTSSELTAYTGSRQTIGIQGVGTYTYVSNSTLTVDGLYVVAATGKGGGKWHLTATKSQPSTMSIANVRALQAPLSLAPSIVSITDAYKTGTFWLDPADTTTADNTGTCLVSGAGLRYKRIIHGGQIHLNWFAGITAGDNQDATAAMQAAVNFAVRVANPLTDGGIPSYSGNPGTILVPPGQYHVDDIAINGAIRIVGQSGGSYGGSIFIQKTAGHSIFLLGADTDGHSNATVLENLMFKSGVNTRDTTVAQVKTVPNASYSTSSIYIRNCWFQTPENYAIWITQGDDINITGCTFDVVPYHAVRIGNGSTMGVSNIRITNNTFFQVYNNNIHLDRARNVLIANNSVYTGSVITTSTFIYGIGSTMLQNVVVMGNVADNLTVFAILGTVAFNVTLSNNECYNITNAFLYLSGGGTVSGFSIAENKIRSLTNFGNAPIYGVGCSMQHSVITNNVFISTTTTALAINMPEAGMVNNLIRSNVYTGFTAQDNLLDAVANGKGLETFNKGSVVTTGWTTSASNQLIAPKTLMPGLYLLNLQINTSGVDTIRAAYILSIDLTQSGGAQPGDVGFTSFSAFNGSRTGTQTFRVRLKLPTTLSGTYGVEATIADAALAGGTLTYSFSPLT